MSDPYPEGAARQMDENGKVLINDGDWNLEEYDGDNGPVMYHIPCGLWTIELNRKYPVCISCGKEIPASMIAPFTLLNWNRADDPEYFVPFAEEEEAHRLNTGGDPCTTKTRKMEA